MIRKIISIDEDKCDGCGLCAEACHERAIGIVDEKAKLLREDYCDGLGDCLPACPQNAITFVEREALEYDPIAVLKAQNECEECNDEPSLFTYDSFELGLEEYSELKQWPVQIKLAAVNANFFEKADLLIAADCTAYAYGNFHSKFMKDKVTLIGCPKLDSVDYSDKLSQIFKFNDIQSICVVKMEVFCCGGLEKAVLHAIKESGKEIPYSVVTITAEGKVIE